MIWFVALFLAIFVIPWRVIVYGAMALGWLALVALILGSL